VYFKDDDCIDDALSKPSVTASMFTFWMAANQMYPDAKNLTYDQFVSNFVYEKKQEMLETKRKKGYTIGRLIWVPPNTSEFFYLRMMLTICKGSTTYEQIRIMENVEYSIFKEECVAMGFLDDDRIH